MAMLNRASYYIDFIVAAAKAADEHVKAVHIRVALQSQGKHCPAEALKKAIDDEREAKDKYGRCAAALYEFQNPFDR